MTGKINLKIYTTTELILDENVSKINFRGKEGWVTLLPKHADYISSFDVNIMSYVDKNNEKKYVALHKGSLIKCKENVKITTLKAIKGNSEDDLKNKIKEIIEKEEETEKQIDINLKKLEYFIFENLMNKKA